MPSNKVLMLTADYYKRNTVVNLNVDEELLHPQIIKAQNVRIEKILGTDLFNIVLAEIDAQTYTARVTTLLEDYIQPALVEWITYTALPYLNYKLTNKSVSKKSSDNSEPSELNEINYLRQNIRDDAEYYSERTTKFLEANTNTYPEYLNGNTDCDDIKPSKLNFISGIYLP